MNATTAPARPSIADLLRPDLRGHVEYEPIEPVEEKTQRIVYVAQK